MDLAVDVGFAHAPRDELGVLRAEIDDQDAVVMLGLRHWALLSDHGDVGMPPQRRRRGGPFGRCSALPKVGSRRDLGAHRVPA